jgi:hypothetical protein
LTCGIVAEAVGEALQQQQQQQQQQQPTNLKASLETTT